MTARNLKLRAIENGLYDKFHLTRTRFEVFPDLMTTDMGNSYLALRTDIRNSITQLPVNTTQIPNEIPRFFCFGDGETAYDGTCLFRTAKLFNKATGAVIEELNYNNLRCNTFKEFTTDFDNLASDTIETGLGIPDAKLNNIQSTYTLWTNAKNSTIELHIPLKSLFPSLNTPFFQLSAVGGLIVDLEWDTTHPLVMSFANPELVIPPPPILSTGKIGFNTVEEEDFSWLVRAQVNSQFAPIEKPFAVERPESWNFPRVEPDVAEDDRYWKSLTGLVYGTPNGAGNYTGIDKYEWVDKRHGYTDADLTQLTLIPVATDANYYADVEVTLLGAGDTQFPFRFSDQITGMDASGSSIQFVSTHIPPRFGTDGLIETRFEGLASPIYATELNGTEPFAVTTFIPSEIDFDKLVDDAVLEISEDTEKLLVKAGILTRVGDTEVVIANQDTTFQLFLQAVGATPIVYMCPDEEQTTGGVTTLITNQKYQLPYEDLERLNAELYTKIGSIRRLFFNRPLNLNYVNGLRPAHGFKILENTVGGSAKTIADANKVLVFFQDIQYAIPILESLPHYPSCDLAEMVLVQYPPAKTPMPKFYRTMTVEPFVIPSGMSEHIQNFMLQPNVYNAWVLLPYPSENTDVSTSPSLISGAGNVYKFRATIDEVDVVNKDIALGNFPDSLYWDKLADAFGNSAMPMKTLTGTVSGFSQRPVRVIPVRIYGGLVNGVVSFSNFMKRLQVRMEATTGESIQAGTAYLYKEMYKAW